MGKCYKEERTRKLRLAVAASCLIMLSGAVAFLIYLNQYYPASEEAVQWVEAREDISFYEEDKAYIIAPEKQSTSGIVFYPGAKVEETAYLPLMGQLAKQGYYCVCVKMPFRMAVFGINRARDEMESHPEISEWYLMGHSLGGAMAASYAGKGGKQPKGLILLAAYAVDDLTAADLQVLTIYGSNDRILNRDKMEENAVNLPDGYMELIIKGGNHAWFGNYGEQKGDGDAQITREQQQAQTVAAITDFIENNRLIRE